MLSTIGLLGFYAFSVYLLILTLRVVLDWIRILSPSWRPKGIVLVVANFLYSVTDPPTRFFRRLIPPLRVGGMALDMGFLVFFILVIMAQRAWITIFFALS